MADTEPTPIETSVQHHSKEVGGVERFSAEVVIGGEAGQAAAAVALDPADELKSL